MSALRRAILTISHAGSRGERRQSEAVTPELLRNRLEHRRVGADRGQRG